jgi:hypothetical protein
MQNSYNNIIIAFSRVCREPACGICIPEANIEVLTVGSGLRISAHCSNGHQSKWQSSEFFNQVILFVLIVEGLVENILKYIFPNFICLNLIMQGRTCATDVRISTLSLLTGLHMEQILEFFKQIDIMTASRASFYRLQKDYINPIIWRHWKKMQAELMERLRKEDTGLTVTGDGQVG